MPREIGWGQTDILLYQIKKQIRQSSQAGSPNQTFIATTTDFLPAPASMAAMLNVNSIQLGMVTGFYADLAELVAALNLYYTGTATFFLNGDNTITVTTSLQGNITLTIGPP